jgi:hypothetical protein
MVVAVSLVIINIAYVSYSFSRKYFTITWPLYVLRNVAKIFVTILFMPLLELFLSIIHCHDASHDASHSTTTTTGTIDTSHNTTVASSSTASTAAATSTAAAGHLFRLLSSSTTDDTGHATVYINSISPEIICFEGTFYIHMIVSIIVAICFLLICLIVAITFFENSEVTENHSAK